MVRFSLLPSLSNSTAEQFNGLPALLDPSTLMIVGFCTPGGVLHEFVAVTHVLLAEHPHLVQLLTRTPLLQ